MDDFIGSSALVPQEYVPNYEENEAGWPSVVSLDYNRSDKCTTTLKWRSLVGSKSDGRPKVSVSKIGEVQALVDFIESDSDLAHRLALPSGGWEGKPDRDRIEFDVAIFLREILGRAHSTGILDVAEMVLIYCRIERSRLAEHLIGDLIVPLPLVKFPETDELKLGDGVSIVRLDEGTQRSRARSTRDTLNAFLSAAATHAVRIQSVSYDNPHWLRRMFGFWGNGTDLTRVDLACQAIDIATGAHVGYAEVLIRPLDWAEEWTYDLPAIHEVATIRRHHEKLAERGWHGPGTTVESSAAARIPTTFQNLSSSNLRVALAARRLFQSNLRTDDDDVVVDCCIGIEALVGDEHDELTHRMAQRAAVVLARRGHDPHSTYAITKKVYGERSSIVHGVVRKSKSFKVKGQEYHTSSTARWLLRELLTSATSVSPAWTPAAIDQRILASALIPDPEG
ncbi:hypothetical protein [Promicromonospora sp. NPDC050249]|uniref:hypothetical protein n=1 Tax=Promicromonospora sp. NPDC050249 TaxID=3154743 RepID=UPI0033E67AAD